LVFICSFTTLIIFYFIQYKSELEKILNKKILTYFFCFLSKSYLTTFHIVSSGIIFLGIIYLFKEKIRCFDKSRLLYAGSVNTIFFDKTGTLTESKLEINGFLYTSINPNTSEIFLKYYNINQVKNLTSILISYYSNYQQGEKDLNDNNSNDKEKKMNELTKKWLFYF
jgi:P-type E1-E2 ATPase